MNNMSDSADIEREMRNMFTRCHMLISRFILLTVSKMCYLERIVFACIISHHGKTSLLLA